MAVEVCGWNLESEKIENRVMSLAGLGPENGCAGEGQQQFN
jgi:hypothetical protein